MDCALLLQTLTSCRIYKSWPEAHLEQKVPSTVTGSVLLLLNKLLQFFKGLVLQHLSPLSDAPANECPHRDLLQDYLNWMLSKKTRKQMMQVTKTYPHFQMLLQTNVHIQISCKII